MAITFKNKSSTTDQSFDRVEAAKYLGISVKFLEDRARKGNGPKFVKYGNHKGARVRYRKMDLDQWQEAQLRENTSQTVEA